jgi:hypothetical protein
MPAIMKGLGRKLFNLAAGVSAVLLVATAIAWPISYWRYEAVARNTPDGGETYLILLAQRLYVSQGAFRESDRFNPATVTYTWRSSPRQRVWYSMLSIGRKTTEGGWQEAYFLGFVLDWKRGPTARFVGIGFPIWFLLLVFAWLPTIAWLRYRGSRLRRRRHAMGLCIACGYDLRATPDRCPECGTAVAKDEGRRMKDEVKAEGSAP